MACTRECRKKAYRIGAAVLCIILVLGQGLTLDYYLATYKSTAWWAWAAADAVNLVVFIVAFTVSFKHLASKEAGFIDDPDKAGGELPLGYTAWLCYSILLVPRVGIIFEDIAMTLKEEYFFGPNTLKTMIALSCIIFMLLVATHHDARSTSKRHSFIVSISHGVTFNVLDTVAILELLFIEDSRIPHMVALRRVVNAFACLNLILPFVPLLVLSRTRYGKESMTKLLRTVHTLLNLCIINLPLFVIRMYLWHARNMNVSVFLIKNILGITFTVKELWTDWLGPKDSPDGAESKESAGHIIHEIVELQPHDEDMDKSDLVEPAEKEPRSRYQFV